MKISVKQLKKIVNEALEAGPQDVVPLTSSEAHEEFPNAFPDDEADENYMPEYDDQPTTFFVCGNMLHAYQPMDVIDHVWTGDHWEERCGSDSPLEGVEEIEDVIGMVRHDDSAKKTRTVQDARIVNDDNGDTAYLEIDDQRIDLFDYTWQDVEKLFEDMGITQVEIDEPGWPFDDVGQPILFPGKYDSELVIDAVLTAGA